MTWHSESTLDSLWTPEIEFGANSSPHPKGATPPTAGLLTVAVRPYQQHPESEQKHPSVFLVPFLPASSMEGFAPGQVAWRAQRGVCCLGIFYSLIFGSRSASTRSKLEDKRTKCVNPMGLMANDTIFSPGPIIDATWP